MLKVCHESACSGMFVCICSGIFVPKKSPNDNVDYVIPDAIKEKGLAGCQILRHTSKSLSRMVMAPFRFAPRLGACSKAASDARKKSKKRRKRRDESQAEQMRFLVPKSILSQLMGMYSLRVCKEVFGIETDC